MRGAPFCFIFYESEGGKRMKELMMFIRPEKLENVKEILDSVKCGGMTISTAMGCGSQKGVVDTVNEIKGLKTTINLLPKIKVEVVVEDKDVERIIENIREKIATGKVGDGKIFVKPVEEAIRIRTGERGDKAL